VAVATNSAETYHDVIVVNVRPCLVSSVGVPEDFLADISHNVEIRAYSTANLELLYTYTGHHGFTLKDCPFYILMDIGQQRSPNRLGGQGVGSLDVVEECSEVQGQDHHDQEQKRAAGGRAGSLDGVLLASGSEDHKVYVWLGNRSTPVQVIHWLSV
jgi:hypothetical protein